MSVSAYSLLRGAVAPLAARSTNEPTGRARASSVRLGTPACRLRRVVLPRHLRTLSVAARAGQGFGKDAPSSPTRSSSPPRTKPATNGATAPQDVAPLAAATEAVPATTVEAEVETTLVEGVPMQAIPAAPQELLYITVPPEPIEGVCQDCSEMDNDELVASDAVYNHELSWTTFNWRVLALALDTSVPLLERLRFLAITARNLDEFFAKRVGGLKRQEAAGVTNLLGKRRAYRWTPTRQLQLVAQCVGTFVERQTDTLMDDVLPALRDAGVHLYNYYELEPEERAELRTWFLKEVEPLLTPLAVDPGHPFPYLTSLALNLAIVLCDPEDPEQENAATRLAIVSLPIKMQRWVKIGENKFVPLEHVVIYNLDRLFGGMEIQAVHVFRATRNADVERNEEEAEDLLEMMTDEVRERRFAPFVRLEANESMDPEMVDMLMREMKLVKDDVYFTKGPLGIGDLFDLPVEFGMDSTHTFPHWAPMTHMRLSNLKSKTSIFSQIRRGDILVHHPYQSFATSTQALIEAAAMDPKVVAIKCTLYRTSNNSPIIDALIRASERGVQVAVLVELKARFDEARNVSFANKLEDAGCNVAYGLVGLKTHCKTTLVIRQEGELGKNELRPYCHIGTGNYNPSTAGVYTDYGLLTCDPELGADVMDLFKYLTGYHRQQSFRKLLVAPTTMRLKFLALIDNEIRHAQAGRKAGLTCKVNGIDDEVITAKLYEASQAGVKVDLIVRGICRVRPGVPGYSENIRVVSIVGQFLEHHRVVRYHNDGKPLYFMGSADWMTRNLMRRVEVATPVEDPALQAELDLCLNACLQDATLWEMQSDGRYVKSINEAVLSAQRNLGVEGGLTKKEDLPARASVVGVQMALMESYRLERRKHKKKARKATAAVRTRKTMGKSMSESMNAFARNDGSDDEFSSSGV